MHLRSRISQQQLVALPAGKTSNVSQAINMAINNPALWAVMKLGARNAMMSTAEKAGIPWRSATKELMKNAEVDLPNCLQPHNVYMRPLSASGYESTLTSYSLYQHCCISS